jgi:hypothetical protein
MYYYSQTMLFTMPPHQQDEELHRWCCNILWYLVVMGPTLEFSYQLATLAPGH